MGRGSRSGADCVDVSCCVVILRLQSPFSDHRLSGVAVATVWERATWYFYTGWHGVVGGDRLLMLVLGIIEKSCDGERAIDERDRM